ncbi:MAG: DUF4386 domain-containing protein [Actinomycetota bacterium]
MGRWGSIFGGSDTRIYVGAVLEFLLVVTNIGTAVVLYPVAKRQSEIGALGYVTARVMECVVIMISLISLLSVVRLRQDFAGAAGTEATAGALVATYEWAFLFGPGLIAGVANGLILGYLMYRSGLVPRRMAMLGLVGGPLLIVAFALVLFGAIEVGSSWQFLLSTPEIAWEASLGIYLAWKGFKTTRIVSLETGSPAVEPSLAAVGSASR